MWNRTQVKDQAKALMHNNYWNMFIVSLVAVLLIGDVASDGSKVVVQFNNLLDELSCDFGFNYDSVLINRIAGMAGIFGSIIFYIYRFFVGNVISVGEAHFYINGHDGSKPALNDLFFGFKNNYLNIVKTMFLMQLYTTLWMLLLIVPGIIKGYEYSMIPYLLAEDPSIDHHEAFDRSKQMTNNQKFNLFTLDLSFIGWYLLGALACGIGTLFVRPYPCQTEAEVYWALKG